MDAVGTSACMGSRTDELRYKLRMGNRSPCHASTCQAAGFQEATAGKSWHMLHDDGSHTMCSARKIAGPHGHQGGPNLSLVHGSFHSCTAALRSPRGSRCTLCVAGPRKQWADQEDGSLTMVLSSLL